MFLNNSDAKPETNIRKTDTFFFFDQSHNFISNSLLDKQEVEDR